MGVLKLLSRGGQVGGPGVKTSNFPKKCLKAYYFLSKKVKKQTILASQGGQVPLFALPCGHS